MTEEQTKIFDEYTKLLNTLNVTLTDADKHLSVNPTYVDMCNVGNDLYDPTANMNPNGPLTIQECEDLLNSDMIQNLLKLDLSDLADKYSDSTDINGLLNDVNDLLNNTGNTDNTDVPDNYAIIEFGDDYILDKAVDYSLSIKPGDDLTGDTIIGTVDLNGNKILKSIFGSGHVVENEDGSFKHIYEGNADRHFIIHGYTMSDSEGLSYQDLNEMNNMVTDNQNLYNLITDHMIYATLPIILANHEDKSECPVMFPCTKSNGNDVYIKLITEYEDYLTNAGSELQTLCSEDSIKATGATTAGMTDLTNLVMDVREQILNNIIGFYKKAGTEIVCIKDVIANWLSLNGYSISLNKKTGNIFNSLYQNYYVYLISNIDKSSDCKYYNEYYDVLNDIIQNRLSKEYIKTDELTSQFNTLYKLYVDKTEYNGYQVLINEFGDSSDTLATSIATWLSTVTYFKDNSDSNVQSNLNSWCTLLANMFLYINNVLATYVDNTDTNINTTNNTTDEENTDEMDDIIIALTEEESEKLKTFWDNKIKEYQDNPLSSVIDKLNEKADEISAKAVWPTPNDITIDGVTYAHYLFKNPFIDESSKEGTDGDEGASTYNVTSDTTEPDLTIPDGPSDEDATSAMDNNLAAKDSDNDPTEDEITITDTKYWQKYYILATFISLPFVADGWDPAPLSPVPMPGIYFCIKAIHIKSLDIVMVLGIAIRGVYVYPIIQINNLTSNYVSALTPLIALLKKIKALFDNAIDLVEQAIPNMAGLLIDKIQTDNTKYINQNIEYEAAMHSLMNLAIEDQALIKKQMDKLLHPDADHRLNIARTEKMLED